MSKRLNPTVKVLKAARRLLAKGWTQGKMQAYCGDKVCYCLAGALDEGAGEVGFEGWGSANDLLRDILVKRVGSRSIVHYNDRKTRTQAQVLKLVDRAIARAEKEAA